MPTPIEQALITLVPTLNELPSELLDLSASLLAQSRAKAATLKPDEEIGRVFACAHLAVDRLKHRLDIDKVVARPPVAPRIYKKLYGYLDAALAPSTPRTNRLKDAGTPGSRGRRSAAGTPSKTPALESKSVLDTPSKTPLSAAKSTGSAAKDVTASGRRTRGSTKLQEKEQQAEVYEEQQDLPEQALPIISTLCAALDAPESEPHVSAALAAILELRGWDAQEETQTKKRRSSAEGSSAKRRRASSGMALSSPAPPDQEKPSPINPQTLPAVLVAMSLMTTFTLRNTIIDGGVYASARSTSINALKELIPDNAPTESSADSFLRASKLEGWLDLPWFTSVKAAAVGNAVPQTPKKSQRPAKTPLRRKEKHAPAPNFKEKGLPVVDETEEIEDGPGAGLKWGLGTMFQDSIDWLSTERRKEYRSWEREIRRRCNEIQVENGAMDVS